MIERAILLPDSIRYGMSYRIIKRYANGVIVGKAYNMDLALTLGTHVAITVDKCQLSTTLHPLVGEFTPMKRSWVFPAEPERMDLAPWLRQLRIRPRLEWLRRLKGHIRPVEWIKVALEDYSLNDLVALGHRGWFVGRSANAPLWRIYAIIPQEFYEDEDLPLLDGEMRSLNRFGAIYDPERHDIVLKR